MKLPFDEIGRGTPGDCHPELERSAEYHRGEWGMGSATVEEGAFLYGLTMALKPDLVVETGTETGYTAAWIGRALRDANHGRLVTIEHNFEQAQAARDNLRVYGVQDRVVVWKDDAVSHIRSLADGTVNMALVDTAIGHRLQEVEALIPKLAMHAVVCVHDTNPRHPMAGGVRLLRDLYAMRCFSVIHLPTPRGLTLLQLV